MSGRLTNTILADLFNVLSSRPAADIGFKVSVTLMAGEDIAISPYTIDSLHLVRNFVGENFDRLQLMVSVPAGDFLTKIYPNRDILQVELSFSYAVLNQERVKVNTEDFPTVVRRYKAHLPDMQDMKAGAASKYITTGDLANVDGMKDMTILLTDIDKDTVLHSTAGTVIRRSTTANAVRGLLTHLFNQLQLSTEKGTVGVDIAPGASEEVHEMILLPHLLEVLAIPKYIQENEYGIYPGGCAAYMQDNVCFIYPPYDTAQVTKGARTVTVLNLHQDVYPAAETTWVENDGEVYILATSETKVVDPTETIQGSMGAGVQYANADSLFRLGSITKDGRLFVNDKSNTVKTSILARRDEFNFLIPGTKPITSNHLHESSVLAKNNGAYARIAWENAKVGLIKPGMAVRFVTIDDMGVKEYHGVIHGVMHDIVRKTKNPVDPLFVSNARIDVFMTYDPVDEYDLTGES